MSRLSKTSALVLTLIIAISCLTLLGVKSATAQPSKPSVPEFSLKIVARPFDVPPVATTNPYTGQTVITHGGYHAENKSIDVIIKNQPSVSYYQIQFKGHYEANWRHYSTSTMLTPIQLTWYIQPSSSEFTVISVPINNEEIHVSSIHDFPEGGQVDFQVRALKGGVTVTHSLVPGFTEWVEFSGETGDWSNTQTITMSSSTWSTSTTPNPTTSYAPITPPSTSGNGSMQITIQISSTNWLLLVAIILVVVITVVLSVVLYTKHRKTAK